MNYIYTYTHGEGKVGVMVEFECSDELSYRTEQFKELALNTALQIIAYSPVAVYPSELAEVVPLNKQAVYEATEISQALVEQPFVKDNSFSYGDILRNVEQELKVILNVRRFVRYGPTVS